MNSLNYLKRDILRGKRLSLDAEEVTAGQVFQRNSVLYQAMLIGQFEMVGLSYKDSDRVVAKIREVTAAQVQEVARKYLVDDRLTVAVLDPLPLDAKAPRAPVKGMCHAN